MSGLFLTKKILLPATSFAALLLFACSPKASDRQTIVGQVEMAEFDLASRLAARVKDISVKLGDQVEAGSLVAIMDDDVIEVRKERAKAGVHAAYSQKKLTDQAVQKEELHQLYVAMKAARKKKEFAELSLERMAVLLKEGAISQQQYDETQLMTHAARAQYEAAYAAYKLGKKGARQEQRDAAQALLDQAATGLAEIEVYDKDLRLTAPVAGEVVQIYARQGELVPQGYPIMTMIKNDDIWFSFFVREDVLSNFHKNATYYVAIPALEKQGVQVRLQYLHPLPAIANHIATKDRGRIDLKTFELRMVPLSLEELKNVRPGMTAVLHLEDKTK